MAGGERIRHGSGLMSLKQFVNLNIIWKIRGSIVWGYSFEISSIFSYVLSSIHSKGCTEAGSETAFTQELQLQNCNAMTSCFIYKTTVLI